jgi:peptide/nickel transport system substrate-binding protein
MNNRSGDANRIEPSSLRGDNPRPPSMTSPARAGMTRSVFLRRSATGLVGVSSLAAFLASCGGEASEQSGEGRATAGKPPAKPTGTLRMAIPADLTTLDPTFGASVAETAVIANVYDGLVAFNEDYSELVPAVASKWESSEDAREWVFTLRDGVKFHDGAELDSTAVRKSVEYTLREGSAYAFAVGQPTDIDDSDPLSVTFRYKDPFPDLARNATFAPRMISPKLLTGAAKKAEAKVQSTMVGTGPYRFVDRARGRSVSAEAFDGYWGKGPYTANLQFLVIPEESARLAALQAGDVDLILQVPPLATRRLAQDTRNTRTSSVQSWSTVSLNLDCSAAPFNDVKVRQAVAHAVDRNAIVEKVLLGQAKVNDSVMPPGCYGYKEPSTTYAHDPARARQLLQEAGHSGKVSARFAVPSDAVLANELASAISGQMNEAGFDVRVQVLDRAVANKDAASPNRKYQIGYTELGWVTGGPLHFSLGTIALLPRYENEKLTDLIARMGSLPDGPEREQVIGEAQDLVARDVPLFTMWVANRADAMSADLQGYVAPKSVFTPVNSAYWLTQGR